MSTSANASRGRDVAPLGLGEVLAIGARDARAATTSPDCNAASASSSAAGAVARARVLEPAVDHRDHGARARATPRAGAAAAARRTAGRTPAATTGRGLAQRADAREQRGERAGARRILRTAGRPLTPEPTSITGSHTAASTRAARAASVSPFTTSRALSVPMRRLAPPVSSTPAIWRIALRVTSERDRRVVGVGPQRVADDGPAVRACARATRRCARSCLRRSTRVTTSALWLPSTNVSTSMLLGRRGRAARALAYAARFAAMNWSRRKPSRSSAPERSHSSPKLSSSHARS